jgi:nucleotide-binding universal stress UspA family protein
MDRSPFSDACLPHAISLAKVFGSALTLVHVMQPRHESTGPGTTDALCWEISRQEVRAYLERLEKEATLALGHPVDVRLEQGHPAERIVALAREIGADLIVLGSHGEGGVTPWNLGSTVQQVLAVARGSVFIVHSSPVAEAVVVPRRILVPLDGSLRTESVLPQVARMASACGAELLLVHVVQELPPTEVLLASDALELAHDLAVQLEASAQRYLERLRNRLAREVAEVRTLVVRHPNERQCLLEISQKERVDLIVLSAHGSACDPARPFGSVAAHLLTHSNVPVLVLQDLPEKELRRVPDADEGPAPPLRSSHPPEEV